MKADALTYAVFLLICIIWVGFGFMKKVGPQSSSHDSTEEMT